MEQPPNIPVLPAPQELLSHPEDTALETAAAFSHLLETGGISAAWQELAPLQPADQAQVLFALPQNLRAQLGPPRTLSLGRPARFPGTRRRPATRRKYLFRPNRPGPRLDQPRRCRRCPPPPARRPGRPGPPGDARRSPGPIPAPLPRRHRRGPHDPGFPRGVRRHQPCPGPRPSPPSRPRRRNHRLRPGGQRR